jgi:hypothetical protein
VTQSTNFYPPQPRPGSNAIGSFQIGVSPIGTIGFPWHDTVLSQYANSPVLLAIIAAFDDAEDVTPEFDAFYDDVWNILTAQGAGLDNWGRILVVSRTLTVDAGEYFGYEEALPGSNGWNQQGFFSGPPSSGNYSLSDQSYLLLLLAKAAFNICDGSIPAMNKILMALFPGRGNAYVQEGAGDIETYFGFVESGETNARGFNQQPFYYGEAFLTMSMQYVFDFALDPVELAIVTQSGVLPTPSGVQAFITIND